MQFRRERKSASTVSLQEALETSKDDSALTLSDVLQDSFSMEENCEGGQPPATQLEVAQWMHISRSYVSRLETHALDQLRQGWEAKP